MAQINQLKFSTYILVILILTTFVFANSMLYPSIAYSKNKAISNTIAGNTEQASSLVTQQSASDTDQASFKNIAFPST